MRSPFSVAVNTIMVSVALAGHLLAEDVFYVKSAQALVLSRGVLPDASGATFFSYWPRIVDMHPYIVLDHAGEAYVASEERRRFGRFQDATIAIRTADDVPIKGRLYWPQPDLSGMVELPFSIPAQGGSRDMRDRFLQTKRNYYRMLMNRDVAGAAWFRHRLRETNAKLGVEDEDAAQDNRRRRFFGQQRANDMENTYALVSGGRAVSENLQLDRVLPRAKPDAAATVEVDSIEGITIREFDWESLLPQQEPRKDKLAGLIPTDQHAFFCPSFQAMLATIDQAEVQGTPVLRAADPRAENAMTLKRYQTQLCLPLGQLERLFGSQLISSVAITGGDPYFRTGTDVAVLFEAQRVTALHQLVAKRVAASGTEAGGQTIQGEMMGVPYTGACLPDRSVCSYVATVGDVVLVTNSTAQLRRLMEVHRGSSASLASLPEYRFFRQRYDKVLDETAFLVISDATIRRWCGPRWRIATSRRTRAAAVMSEMQATNISQIVRGGFDDTLVKSTHGLPGVEQFILTKNGIVSSAYGSLAFQTPIMEMDFQYVTEEEKRFYQRWRTGYQRRWRNVFDPIAARFLVNDNRLAVDLTVMPLISNSDYRTMSEVSRGAQLGPQAGDPHTEALAHWVLALNQDSELLKQYGNMASAFAPQIRVNPLSWLGNAVAFYVDEDPFWQRLTEAPEPDDFIQDNLHRLPIALHFAVRSGMKLTAFLASARGFIEQSAPGMTIWETLHHREVPYVKVSPSERAKSDEQRLEDLSIYYAANGEALILTLNEDVLKRAIDRQVLRAEGKELAAARSSWIGENFCLQAKRQLMDLWKIAGSERYQQTMQTRSWGNIPILNEWQRRFPHQNPLEVHAAVWHRQLVCPGGGEYRWNERWQTMESSIYGHPAQPKKGPLVPVAWQDVDFGNFGITFQDNGLRARVELSREAK